MQTTMHVNSQKQGANSNQQIYFMKVNFNTTDLLWYLEERQMSRHSDWSSEQQENALLL